MQDVLAPFSLGLLIGGMGIFSFMVAPMAFRALPVEAAGRFVRGVFPHYYLFVIAVAAFSAAAFVGPAPYLSKFMLLIALLGVLARQVLMPRINALRDRSMAGDAKAGRWFDRLHMASVGINVVQLGVAVAVLAVYV